MKMPPDRSREPNQPSSAEIVSGNIEESVKGPCELSVPYDITLTRRGPGNVEFRLTVGGKTYGVMPFDNLVKAATRIDPDHAVGPEKQIRELREELSKARADMYDWQAKTMQAESRVAALEEQLAREGSRH